MEEKLKNMVEQTLNIPCSIDGEATVFPCATFDIYERPGSGLYGGGKNEQSVADIQLDLWYTEREPMKTASEILKNTIAEEFTAPDLHRYYDTTSKKYRCTFNFNALLG